jgi:hypothetical protein
MQKFCVAYALRVVHCIGCKSDTPCWHDTSTYCVDAPCRYGLIPPPVLANHCCISLPVARWPLAVMFPP